MSQSKRVSVIIPTRNRAELMPRAVKSVQNQTHDDIEIIVVDDSSSDATPQVVADLQKHRVPLIYIRNQTALGGGGARNAGLKKATGTYIAFLDDDDAWHPRKLELQLPYADDHSIVGCQTSYDFNLIQGRKQDLDLSASQWPAAPATIKTRAVALNDVFFNNGGLNPTVMLTRRSLMNKIGGLDETLPGAQGRDLSVRLIAAGGPAIMVLTPLTMHFVAHGKERISTSPTHLAGCWRELEKHRSIMPWRYRIWRSFTLTLRGAKEAPNTAERITNSLRSLWLAAQAIWFFPIATPRAVLFQLILPALRGRPARS